jgi:hypothetical protein
LHPDEERVLSLKYKIEYPTGNDIELKGDDECELIAMDGIE